MSLSATDLQKKISNGKGPLTPKKLSNTTFDVERIRVEDEGEIERKYQMGETLGKGAFGVVREVTRRESKEKFAMKIVPKDKPGSISILLLEREVEVLKRVNHPNIIKLEAVYETAKKMYMIMELCVGGELSEELKKRTYFKEDDAKVLMRKVIEALVYMHDYDMVHRDLKLENILLVTSDPNDFNIRVTDFGLANMKGLPGCEDLMHVKCGTPYYMAPEVLNTKHEYTKMCDVWSVGVIMYSLLCGRYPFYSTTPAKLEEVIQIGNLTFREIEWSNVSPAAKDLLMNMLCVDTTSRYTARRILDDPWFTGSKSKRIRNAVDLMRDIELENQTTIVVSSPSTTALTSHPSTSSPSNTTRVTQSHTSHHTPQKKVSSQGTPTKKATGTHPKLPLKTRTFSTSAVPGSTSKSGSGSLHSSSGVTSPSHKPVGPTGTGMRPRGSTYSSGTKSQVLSPGGTSLGSLSSSQKGSAESVQSSSSRERKLTSPARHTRTKT